MRALEGSYQANIFRRRRASAASRIHCFSSLVIVLTPPISVAVKITLSPGRIALTTKDILNLELFRCAGSGRPDGAAVPMENDLCYRHARLSVKYA